MAQRSRATIQHIVVATQNDPSDWSQRLPVLSVALFGMVVAIALAGYQLKMIDSIWDPFFGSGSSERVVSTSFLGFLPIPDAVLGVLGYGAEILVESIGGPQRWKQMPGLALLSGLVFVGMALVSLGLIVLQAFVVHAWCSLCLTSAAISFTILALGYHEPLAAWQVVHAATQRGTTLWDALWGKDNNNAQ